MKAQMSIIQQMLTSEVANVLVRSAAEAEKRKHGQTTPLHVAATSDLLRRSRLRSQPDSSRPPECDALELCFCNALDRLPSDGGQASGQPPMSSALKAALKRAQASQRRGCPEHSQQLAAPLLAGKVEIEKLVVSILDDPQVIRVMWEAGFSSTTVKVVFEQLFSSSSSNSFTSSTITNVPVLTMTPSPVSPVPPSSPAHLSVNPPLLNGSGAAGSGDGKRQRSDEVKRVMSTLSRFKKRNPIVLSDFNPQAVTKAVIQTIESGVALPPLHTAKVVSFAKQLDTAIATGDKYWFAAKIIELGNIIQRHAIGGVVVDIGDLKCLVENPVRSPTTTSSTINAQQTASETACAAVAEMARLLNAFRNGGLQVWLLGTATYTTYLRCQVYHPTMDDDWDLQAVQIAQSFQILPRTGEQFPEILHSSRSTVLCPVCTECYWHATAKATHQSPSEADVDRTSPPWLQLAKLSKESGSANHLLSEETLLQKWQGICSRLHSKAPPPPLPLCSGNSSATSSLPETSVNTDLVLGNSVSPNPKEPKKVEFLNQQQEISFTDVFGIETFERLYKGLLDKVSWQPEAASVTVTTLLRPQTGHRRGHTWLLYLGPDKIGKRKMATALSELVFGAPPVVVKLSDDCEEGECTVRFRGWTSMDRLAEAIRRNPFSMVLIEEFDRADVQVRRSIKRATEQGRMVDSYGREVSLGSVVFVLTSNWLPEEFKRSHESLIQRDEKVLLADDRRRRRQQLELSTGKTPSKRCVDCLGDGDKPAKMRRPPPLSLDLNLALGTAAGDDPREGSSDVTAECSVSKGRLVVGADEHSTLSVAPELAQLVDAAVVFKPLDFAAARRRAAEAISKSFAALVEKNWPIRFDEAAIDQVVGDLGTADHGLDEWCERVLAPLLKELKRRLMEVDRAPVVQLSVLEGSGP